MPPVVVWSVSAAKEAIQWAAVLLPALVPANSRNEGLAVLLRNASLAAQRSVRLR